MRITLLGTGYAIPTPNRVQSGLLLDLSELILFDCGSGVLLRLAQTNYDHMDIDHIFFTHHHLDHNSDFLALLKADFLRGRNHLRLYGPIGTKDWVAHLLEAYPYLKGRFDLEIRELDGERVKMKDCVIKCEKMEHSVPTLGYKVTSEEGSFVYTGDTMPCDGVKRLCKDGVKLLIHECTFPDPREGEKAENHTTPRELGRLIRDLPVERLVITHFAPEAEGHQLEMVRSISGFFDGKIIIAHDLLEIEV